MAVVRIRGRVDVPRDLANTLKMLRLNYLNHCVIIDDRKSYLRMLYKAKDIVAWGELDEKGAISLLTKRGRLPGDVRLTDDYVKDHTSFKSIEAFAKAFCNGKTELKDIPGLKPVFRLHPPKKGHRRGGIKKSYTLGGALGPHGSEINALVHKMA
ncbi:MAG: 50S ribosomal protein L30 [Candidatus Heimdallarchaeota archaeon]